MAAGGGWVDGWWIREQEFSGGPPALMVSLRLSQGPP